jgi:PAS domain S-box-containing protein
MYNFIQQLPGVIYEFTIRNDGTMAFTFLSTNCIDILGVRADDAVHDYKLLNAIIYSEDRNNFKESCKQSFLEKKLWSWEGRIIVRNEVRWIEARSNYEIRENDIIRKGIVLDITDRKIREQESELRYQSLVEHLPVGVGVHVGGKLVFANRHAGNIMAATPNDLIGKSVIDLVHPRYREKVIERMARVVKGEALPMVEEKFIRLDGEIIDVEIGAIPFTFNGQPASQLIVRDITDRKKAEIENKKNEKLFTQLFNSVPMGVVMLDEKGKVVQVNEGFREMFDYDQDLLLGKNLNDFIVPEELSGEGIGLNNLITSKKIVSVATKRKHKDGHLIDVLLYGVPVKFGNRTIGIYGVYVDITDRKKVEEELKVRNSELDNFVYKVSHDLRAPLSSILGLVNLARLPGNDDDPMEYIDIIGKKVEGLDHFISDVLSHSKNLKIDLHITTVDFNTIINKTFADLNYLEGASEMMVYRKIDGDCVFHSDPWRISEIFRNLASNAIKYRKEENEIPEIRIEIKCGIHHSEITFKDNGIGIEQKNLSKIFDMFYRATEQSSGSGIGLYIVKNAVEKLGGTISATSEFGEGTTFTIILPNHSAEVKAGNAVRSVLQKS